VFLVLGDFADRLVLQHFRGESTHAAGPVAATRVGRLHEASYVCDPVFHRHRTSLERNRWTTDRAPVDVAPFHVVVAGANDTEPSVRRHVPDILRGKQGVREAGLHGVPARRRPFDACESIDALRPRIKAHNDDRVAAAAHTVQPTGNLQVITTLAVHCARTQRHAYAGKHQVERPMDPEVRTNDGHSLISLVEQQRGVAWYRRESCGKPILRGSRACAADRRSCAASEIGNHDSFVESIRNEDATVSEFADPTNLREIDWQNPIRSLDLDCCLNRKENGDDHGYRKRETAGKVHQRSIGEPARATITGPEAPVWGRIVARNEQRADACERRPSAIPLHVSSTARNQEAPSPSREFEEPSRSTRTCLPRLRNYKRS